MGIIMLFGLYVSIRKKNYDWFVAFLFGLWGVAYSFMVGVVEKNFWEGYLNFPDWILFR